jgi:hypothetical protein
MTPNRLTTSIAAARDRVPMDDVATAVVAMPVAAVAVVMVVEVADRVAVAGLVAAAETVVDVAPAVAAVAAVAAEVVGRKGAVALRVVAVGATKRAVNLRGDAP